MLCSLKQSFKSGGWGGFKLSTRQWETTKTDYFVCTFSWKENKYYMCNNKSLFKIEDIEDQKTILTFVLL